MTDIIKTGYFTLSATCTPVQRPPNCYHIRFTTHLATARDPLAPQTAYAVTLTEDELKTLRDTLNPTPQAPNAHL